MNVMAIDPGPDLSNFVLVDENIEVIEHGVGITNHKMLALIKRLEGRVVVELVEARGYSVGQDTFDTMYWAGRFIQYAEDIGKKASGVFRRNVKNHLLNTKADNEQIVAEIQGRYGGKKVCVGGDKCKPCHGNGWTGREHKPCEICGQTGYINPPGRFYGLISHEWQALALAIYAQQVIMKEIN